MYNLLKQFTLFNYLIIIQINANYKILQFMSSLTGANMRILPNGLNNAMTTFKEKLSDSNKNFVKFNS